jgi:hypothetical protein
MPLNPLAALGANHIAAQNGRFDPQTVNNALIHIEGLETFGLSLSGVNENILSLAIATFSLPKVSNEVIEVGYLNSKSKFAGQAVVDSIQVEYRDYVSVGVARVLQNWRNAVHDPQTGRVGLPSNYKRSGTIELYASDSSVLRQFKLEGIFPSSFGMTDFDHDSSDQARIQIELSVDRCYPADSSGWQGALRRVLAAVTGALS